MQGRSPKERGNTDEANGRIPNDQIPGFSRVEPLLRRLIRLETDDQQVDELAKQIDDQIEGWPDAKQRLKEIAGRVHNIYGSDRAKEHLKRWAGFGKAGSEAVQRERGQSAESKGPGNKR